MNILYLDQIDSTHKYLRDYIKKNGYQTPVMIVTQNQTNGIGSRNNSWYGVNGNLFFSFVLSKDFLPNDLKIESASIYFSFLFKEILNRYGSLMWLKWPNDFYLENKKIGGTITTLHNDLIFCGIGMNLVKVSDEYGVLDVSIDIKMLLKEYFELILSKPLWKQVFSKFEIEFKTSKEYKTTINQEKISLADAVLLEDGSLVVNNKKVYSLR